MHQKLLQRALLLSLVIVAVAFVFNGCIDEPNPPVIEKLISKVRFVHAEPATSAVDIWVDGKKEVSGLSYKNFHDYIDVKSGVRLIQLTAAGQSDTTNALYASMLSIRSLNQMTIFFYPGQDGLTAFIAQEKFTYANEEKSIAADSSRVRVINLTNQAAIFRKDANDGPIVIEQVEAGSLNPYRNFIAGSSFSCFVVTPAGADVTNVQVNPAPQKRYTYFLMGSAEPFLLVMNDYSLPTYP